MPPDERSGSAVSGRQELKRRRARPSVLRAAGTDNSERQDTLGHLSRRVRRERQPALGRTGN